MRKFLPRTCVPFLFSCPALATTWTVGPSQAYTLPSQVSTLVSDGDTVNIEAGVYPSDVARWTANNLVLRGIGGFAHLKSNGNSWGGKAIWVIQGDNCTVEWIEFIPAKVTSGIGSIVGNLNDRLVGVAPCPRSCGADPAYYLHAPYVEWSISHQCTGRG